MRINADTLFSKGSNNYMLEEVMESKNFSDEAKSLILNIVYKIDNSYQDYSKLKFNVKTKEEIIAEITSILKNDCDVIEIEATEEFKNSFSVDSDKKIIKVFPSEIAMVQALYYIKKLRRNNKVKNFFNKVFIDAVKKRIFSKWSRNYKRLYGMVLDWSYRG